MIERDLIAPQSYLVFQVGENEFALPLSRVRQIISGENLRGAIHTARYRGREMDVLDLGERLAVGARTPRQRSIIVLDAPTAPRGVLVDSAPVVTTIEARQIRPLPTITRSAGDPYEGVVKFGDERLVIVLDPARL